MFIIKKKNNKKRMFIITLREAS